MEKLIEFEDTQAALFLLRLSFGIVRATHFMRTTPLSLWSKQAEDFDAKVRDTTFQCLGLKPTPEAYDQASVSTKIGGLGIRRIVDHAKGAFTASWHESQVITHESWSKPSDCDCSDVYHTQHRASATIDSASMGRLVAVADKRDVQRLNRLDSPLGFPLVPPAWTVMTLSFPPKSFALLLPVSSVNLCTRTLLLVLFASKPWIFTGITPYAAARPGIGLRGTTA